MPSECHKCSWGLDNKILNFYKSPTCVYYLLLSVSFVSIFDLIMCRRCSIVLMLSLPFFCFSLRKDKISIWLLYRIQKLKLNIFTTKTEKMLSRYVIDVCSSNYIIEIQLQLLVTLYCFKEVLLTFLTVV